MKYPGPLTASDEELVFREPRLVNKIVLHNMRAVVGRTRMACRKWKALDYDEVFSELQLCLLRCVSKFNPHKHLKFSTYLNCAINDCIVELNKKQMRKNEVDIMPLHKSMRGKVGTERPSGRAGRIDSIANKSYKEKERQDDFLENIQDHLKRNQAMLPPRSIRLLRSLYLDKLPTNIHTIAIGRGVGDSVVVTQIRRLLKQLKAGIK